MNFNLPETLAIGVLFLLLGILIGRVWEMYSTRRNKKSYFDELTSLLREQADRTTEIK